MKRVFCILMILAICFASMPNSAWADGDALQAEESFVEEAAVEESSDREDVIGDEEIAPEEELAEEGPPEEDETSCEEKPAAEAVISDEESLTEEPVVDADVEEAAGGAEEPMNQTPTDGVPEAAQVPEGVLASGTCGEQLSWWIASDYTLTITGTGEMEEYWYQFGFLPPPWAEYRYSIPKVVLESGITSISDCAFYQFSLLEEITIPEGVLTIGEYAFAECGKLKTVNLPASVTSIKQNAFLSEGLSDVQYAGTPEQWESVSVSSGNDAIVTAALEKFGRLTGSCGDAITWTLTREGVLTLTGTGDMSDFADNDYFAPWYSSRTFIRSVQISEGITSVSRNAFNYCENLTSVQMPDSIRYIGGAAFSGCRALTEVNLPEGLETIEYSAFYGCSSLESIDFGSRLEVIGNSAFGECRSLKHVQIPASTKKSRLSIRPSAIVKRWSESMLRRGMMFMHRSTASYLQRI